MFFGSAAVTPCVAAINFHYLKEEERIKKLEAALAEAEAMQGCNAWWQCRVVAERFLKKSKSNWAHYFSVLCEPFDSLTSHSWLYSCWSISATCFFGYTDIPTIQAPTERGSASALLDVRILLNFCWSASLFFLTMCFSFEAQERQKMKEA